MFLLLAMGAGIGICALLWRVAIYALPAFVGFSIGFWALDCGAGGGAIMVGVFAGIAAWTVARWAALSEHTPVRAIVTIFFAAPAAYTAFEIVWQISGMGGTETVWRAVFACLGGLAASLTTIARLSEPHMR